MPDAQRDDELMARAMALAAVVRSTTSPNPWVGCVVATPDGATFEGATQPPGGAHAEIVALAAAGDHAAGATLYSTLEPCAHHGRTPPCTDAILEAGISRVVVAVGDPDPLVEGKGLDQLRQAGVTVEVGLREQQVRLQLQPYLKHRTTGRPWVVLKLAATLDGRTAAPDGTSRWITGRSARDDAHRLRSESDAVLVGAGTVRADDPALTVRTDDPALTVRTVDGRRPQRVVLGTAGAGARVHPALELNGDLGDVLDDLGQRGILQLLVEGGAGVAHGFHTAGLVDRYVFYMAPALLGGDDGRPMFAGAGAPTIDDAWRGRIVEVTTLGPDLRIDLERTGTN
ncbi:MAG TPA: bifunctional diaminohydroxyphosphoribosylaminopyrimidine deaminase/5-amino-6-(5-phosphoribosylamino)uracil reductase RibD [Acidimicrobiales bacterium]|nr:bifunctional diaminohydroxyphosphoribosylaminopyrimidine deaminase/5-amino-6-(5-phosphoribosylamino)uracil reductase RibD [Acidimicrobiales bacterium]